MATITIDGTAYDTDQLSEAARAQVVNLQFVEVELQRLQAQIAVFTTAKARYAQVLKAELNPSSPS